MLQSQQLHKVEIKPHLQVAHKPSIIARLESEEMRVEDKIKEPENEQQRESKRRERERELCDSIRVKSSDS